MKTQSFPQAGLKATSSALHRPIGGDCATESPICRASAQRVARARHSLRIADQDCPDRVVRFDVGNCSGGIVVTGVHAYTVQLQAGPALIVGHVHSYARAPLVDAEIALFPGICANADDEVLAYALVSVRWPAVDEHAEPVVQYWLTPAELDAETGTFVLAAVADATATESLAHIPDAVGDAVRSVGLPHVQNVPVLRVSGDETAPGSAT